MEKIANEHVAAARRLVREYVEASKAAPIGAHAGWARMLVDGIAGELEALDDKWRAHWDQAIRERDSARQEVVAANGVDYWAWQQGGGNHLESMGETMVVQMTAGNLRAMIASAADPKRAAVGGDTIDMSIAMFIQRCEVHLAEMQEQSLPDNALIAVLCDAVRLAREYGDRRSAKC